MHSLTVFEFNAKQVRIIDRGGEPWFVAKDLCEVLEIGNVSHALRRLDDDEKNTVILKDGTAGNPEKSIVSESGMYALVLTSRKPEAKPFRKWITSLLSSVRKHPEFSEFMSQNKQASDRSGFVYLAIAAQTRWCKIGMSKQPYKRMSSLQTGSPLEITLIHRVFTFDMAALEKSLHDYYDAYRLRGEWFDLPDEYVREFPVVANELDAAIERACLPR